MKLLVVAKNVTLLLIILVLFYSSAVLVRYGEFHEDVFVVLERYFPILFAGWVFFKTAYEIGLVRGISKNNPKNTNKK